MQDIASMAIRINDFMCGMFAAIDIRLIDFKLEFGVFSTGFQQVILPDEISPDGCNFGTCILVRSSIKIGFAEI